MTVFAASPAFAQYRIIAPPATYGNPSLRNIEIGFTIPELCDGTGEFTDAWSSSFLKAEGKPPQKPKLTGDEDEDLEAESYYSMEYAGWAAMYSAGSVRDGSPATAWVEGVKGPGIGDVVIAPLPRLTGIGILSGFQRNADLFSKNARPRKVRVWLLAAGRKDAGQYDLYYLDVKALACRDVELADKMGWQALPLPSPPADTPPTQTGESEGKPTTVWFAAVQILSVYPGSRWEDCCISEIGPIAH
jgi:hypothetical protein